MRHVIFVILAAHMSILTGRLLAGDQPVTGDELTTLKREYADVLALQGTSKGGNFGHRAGFYERIPRWPSTVRRRVVEYCFKKRLRYHGSTSLPSRSGRRRILSTSSTPLV